MPPFNDPDLRRAMALSLDRKAFVDTLTLGKGDLGGVMQPLPELGYWSNKRLSIKVSTRNLVPYRDAAIILIDQLKEIYVDGELEPVDTVQWYPKLMRGDYTVGLNLTGNGLDDPDQTLYENFTCGAEGNYDRFCNPELDKMVDRQSMEFDQKKRKELVWAIERKLAEDAAQPILWHNRTVTCWQPYVKSYTFDGQQRLQRLAYGRRLARQIAVLGLEIGGNRPSSSVAHLGWQQEPAPARTRSNRGSMPAVSSA